MSTIIEELDYLMELDEAGIVSTADETALNGRIQEWFDTPQGTVADAPAWGHNLLPLKFEPPGANSSVMAAMNILEKMPRDIGNLLMYGVAVEFTEIDLMIITMDHALGRWQGEVNI